MRLTTSERRLLASACSGLTDREICADLGLSPNTLKATWRQIYDRFEARAPHVLSCDEVRENGHGSRRGIEKRRRVVSYVQEHLEELRPFSWN